MNIGVDIDGVLTDLERMALDFGTKMCVEENIPIELNLSKYWEIEKYNWTKEQQKDFTDKFFLQISKESNLMSGFIGAYNYLKGQGHEFVVITARGLRTDGTFMKEMEDDAKRVLNESNIIFDKYYWGQADKLNVCKKENVDVMIDDDWKIIEKLSANNIRTLYFRDTNLKKLEENKYIKEVNNWGDICRYISEIKEY